jgi:thiamine biosynthesis lipoprotein ApbE
MSLVGRGEQIASPVYETETDRRGDTVCITVFGDDPALAEDAMARLLELLDRFDASDANSEIGRANAAAGAKTGCSLETALLVTMLEELSGSAAHVELDPPSVRVAPGRRIAPGRIAVGLAMDMVVHDLEEAGAMGAMVRVADDARVVGASPYREGWTIELPGRTIRMIDGAAVTISAPAGSPVTGVTVTADAAWRAAAAAASR